MRPVSRTPLMSWRERSPRWRAAMVERLAAREIGEDEFAAWVERQLAIPREPSDAARR